MLGGATRARGRRRSGAGALPVPVPAPPDRGRPRGLLPGHWRRLAAARTSRPAPDSRCRCGRALRARHGTGWMVLRRTCEDPALELRWRTGTSLASAGPRAETACLGAALDGWCHRQRLFRGRLVGADVDPPTGQPGGEPCVLALLADRERELVVGHHDPRGP